MARERSRERERRRSPARSPSPRGRKRSRSRSRDRYRSRSRERRHYDPEPAPAASMALPPPPPLPAGTLVPGMAGGAFPPPPLAGGLPGLGGMNSALNAAVLAAAAVSVSVPTIPVVPNPAAGLTASQLATAQRKAREVYIGNLAIGTVNADVLKELFNKALAGMVPDPLTNPPVVEVKMDPTTRYAFVELRDEELATAAIMLDKTELAGRPMNIGRPKGYVPGVSGATPADKLKEAQQLAAKLAGGVTNVLLLEGLLDAGTIRDPDERQEVSEMVYEEALKCGKVTGIAVPPPPPVIPDSDPCRVYVKFALSSEATRCKEMMDGRMFDDNKIRVEYVTEVDYSRARNGEWVIKGADGMDVTISLPAPSQTPFTGSLTGLPTITV